MTQGYPSILRSHFLKATRGRIELLAALEKAARPRAADELHRCISADLVTVYRNLQQLVGAGLVREVRFKDAIRRYEYARTGHHHHLVCTSCGTIDELPACEISSLEKSALKASKRFASVDEHSLEFFGTCTNCSNR